MPNGFQVTLMDKSVLKYPNVNVTRGEDLQLVVANGGNSSGMVHVYASGLPLAFCEVGPTGSWSQYTILDCGVLKAGQLDLELRFYNNASHLEFARLDRIQLKSK